MHAAAEMTPTPSALKKWVSTEARATDSTTKRPRSPAKPQPIEAASLPDALLRVATVIAITGLSSATVYRKVATGEFPEPIRLGARCTRWHAASVRAWLAAQTATATAE